MTGVVFMETLRRSWRSMLWWGLGIGALAMVRIVIVPDVQALQQIADLMQSLPPFLVQAVGGGDVAAMATPEGYLAISYFGIVLLVFAIYAVSSGLSVTANDEDRGVLDIVLSLPIPRWKLILEKFLAYTLLLTGVVFISFLGIWLGILVTPALAVDMGKVAAATFNVLPGALAVMAFTVFVAVLARRRGLALAIAAIFVVGGYFLSTLAEAAPSTILEPLSYLSYYRYYDGAGALIDGLAWGNILVLLGATALFLAGGIWFFQRRDVGL